MGFSAGQRRLIDEVRDALASSLDIHEVVAAAEPPLRRLVGADHIAVGVTAAGASGAFEWILADMPPKFFAAYPELASHDFVLRAVAAAPHRVLLDSDMLPRRELEASVMYGRSRDLGMPIEQVMSAMLQAEGEWAGGISLFRSSRRIFSEQDRAILQSLVPALRSAIRNCWSFGDVAARANVVESVLHEQGSAVVLLAPPAREVARTAAASRLLERWFQSSERSRSATPEVLLEWGRELVARPEDTFTEVRVLKQGPTGKLLGKAFRFRSTSGMCLALVVTEEPVSGALPAHWSQRLTAREQQVVMQVIEGLPNRWIAEELGIKASTLKKHLSNVFDKLGVDSRAQLMAAARRGASST